jgi:hypothetical protein
VSRRHVSIHLTPYAPGVGAAPVHAPERQVQHWSKTPAWILQDLAARLEVGADQLVARAHADDLEILGPSPHAAGPVVLALVSYGLDLDEVAGALAGLAQGRRVAA